MKAKAKVSRVTVMNLEVNGVEIGTFTHQEDWRGLSCFQNADGELIVSSDPIFGAIGGILSIFDNKSEGEVCIVSASPKILDKIIAAEGKLEYSALLNRNKRRSDENINRTKRARDCSTA